MFCENCGVHLPDNARFCPECGAVVKSAPEPASPRCPNCGAELEQDSFFCENCGYKLSDGAAFTSERASTPESPHDPYVTPAPSAVPEKPQYSYIPPAPETNRSGSSVPSAPDALSREIVPPRETKPKKKGGCCVVVLILLVLLSLVAAYYILMVYEGETPIDRFFPGMKPTVQSLLSTAKTVLTKVPETISEIATKPTEIVSQVIVQPTAASVPDIRPTATAAGSSWDPARTVPTGQPDELISLINAKPTAAASVKTFYDPNQYSATEMSRLQDFLWVTQDIAHGTLPAGIDRLNSFDELLGSWKAWIIDDLDGQYGSGIERLCQVNFTKNANGNGMTFSWVYVHNTKIDEGYDDNTPPTTFFGEMQNGRFYGLGVGSIDMTDFYVLNGHEYAVGMLHWPDASKGTVFLVRP